MQYRFTNSFFRSRTASRIFALSMGSLVVLGAEVASASPNFPTVIQEELGMACVPRCTVCHTVEPGKAGTALRPFAVTLSGLGLKAAATETLIAALSELPADVDSDEDGVPDLVELQGGAMSDPAVGSAGAPGTDGNAQQSRNPSLPPPEDADVCADVVGYGCGAHVAPRPSLPRSFSWLWAAVTSMLVGFAWAGRRRSRRGG